MGFSGLYQYFTNGENKYRNQLNQSVSAPQFVQCCEQIVRTYGSQMGQEQDFKECCTQTIESIVLDLNPKENHVIH